VLLVGVPRLRNLRSGDALGFERGLARRLVTRLIGVELIR
jgi:hypothetical protein